VCVCSFCIKNAQHSHSLDPLAYTTLAHCLLRTAVPRLAQLLSAEPCFNCCTCWQPCPGPLLFCCTGIHYFVTPALLPHQAPPPPKHTPSTTGEYQQLSVNTRTHSVMAASPAGGMPLRRSKLLSGTLFSYDQHTCKQHKQQATKPQDVHHSRSGRSCAKQLGTIQCPDMWLQHNWPFASHMCVHCALSAVMPGQARGAAAAAGRRPSVLCHMAVGPC
jgi:hypothetical protein